MSKVEDFLNQADEAAIVEAICLAEKATSGEIRVHIEKTASKAAYERVKGQRYGAAEKRELQQLVERATGCRVYAHRALGFRVVAVWSPIPRDRAHT
jgi:hypothetical protein